MMEDALAWAARGFRVFPIVPGGKTPPAGMRFKQEATTDPAKIQSWWSFEPRYNMGVAAGDGVLIVDVDAGKNGFASLMDLELPDATLTVATPGGGYHLYFLGPDVQNSVDRIGPGIDIRSAGGYVVGPGSFFADPGGKKGYTGRYSVAVDAPALAAPAGFVLRCGEPKKRDEGPAVNIDEPDDIVYAIHYLAKDAPASVKGRGGNNTAYAVAARVLEIGVSVDLAVELMLEHWNDRCPPGWAPDRLRLIVEHAATYMQARQGSGGVAALADQGGDPGDVVAPVATTARGKFDKVFEARPLRDLEDIPPRDWIVDGFLLRKKTTVLSGPGGSGKSGFTVAMAAHGAVGLSFAGYHIARPFKTIIYNWEDDLDEMEKRLHATCATYGLDVQTVARSVLLWPGEMMRFRLTNRENQVETADVREMARLTKGGSFDLVVMDPLISLHTADENDNMAMGEVMAAAAELARLADAACLIPTHTPKSSKSTGGAGSAEAFRGAGNIINSVRLAHTLFPADERDAAFYGLGEGFKDRYIRLDGAKNNLGPVRGKPAWFEKVSFPLPNGGTVQSIRPFEASESAKGEAKLMATVLAVYMNRRGSIHLDLHSAAQILYDEEQVFRERVPVSGKLDTLRAQVQMRLTDAVELDDGTTVKTEMLMKDGDSSARRYITLT